MQRSHYRQLTSTAEGRAIRELMRNGVGKNPPPLSHLRAEMDQAGITDEKLRADVLDRIRALVKRAREGVDTFEMSQHADLAAVELLKQVRVADSLLGEHDIEDDADHAEGHDVADLVAGRARGLDDEQISAEKAERAERERLRKLGVRVDGAA